MLECNKAITSATWSSAKWPRASSQRTYMLVGLMQSVARDILLAQIVLLDGMVAFKVLQTIGQEVAALAEYARIIKIARNRGF